MITREIILNIIENAQKTNISIYLPTHKKGEEVQQDPIRLKNLLRDIKNELSESGMKEDKIDRLLEEPKKLLDQPLFWQHNDKGLALFISEDYFNYFRAPLEFTGQYLIDSYFLITPLLPMVSLEGTFCILAVSQKDVRLLKATRDSVEKVALEEAPASIEDFQKYDVYEKSLSSASGPGGSKSMFHGWGDASIESKAVENYLKTIENEVTSILRKRNDPLILAGVDQAVSLYKKVNHYARLPDPVIKGNPDPKSDEEIRDEGWQIVKSYFLREMYDDMERFADLTGSDKQSDDLTTIVEGAWYGRVDSLFVPIGEHRWGWFDEKLDMVHHSPEKTNSVHDLINLAAIKTLTQGGNVYALRKDDMPNSAAIAAIFRYS